jgi:hypothetical protein
LRERNRLLEAAGFARAYRETQIDDPSLEHIGHIIDLLLESHDPAGAVAVDWGWNVVKANRSMLVVAAFFSEPELLADAPPNVMKLMFAPNGMHRYVVNWDEVGAAMVTRIRREAEYEGRPESGELLDELLASPAVPTNWKRSGGERPAPPLLPLHLRRGDVELELFSTITTLGTPQDITLQELRIESFHPMNPRSAAALRDLVDRAAI